MLPLPTVFAVRELKPVAVFPRALVALLRALAPTAIFITPSQGSSPQKFSGVKILCKALSPAAVLAKLIAGNNVGRCAARAAICRQSEQSARGERGNEDKLMAIHIGNPPCCVAAATQMMLVLVVRHCNCPRRHTAPLCFMHITRHAYLVLADSGCCANGRSKKWPVTVNNSDGLQLAWCVRERVFRPVRPHLAIRRVLEPLTPVEIATGSSESRVRPRPDQARWSQFRSRNSRRCRSPGRRSRHDAGRRGCRGMRGHSEFLPAAVCAQSGHAPEYRLIVEKSAGTIASCMNECFLRKAGEVGGGGELRDLDLPAGGPEVRHQEVRVGTEVEHKCCRAGQPVCS